MAVAIGRDEVDGIKVQVIGTPRGKEECQRIRYRAYRDQNFIPHDDSGLYGDTFDELDSTIHLGVRHDRGLVGTMRLCFSENAWDGQHLPCFGVYAEMHALRAAVGGKIVELSRLAIDPSVTNTSYKSTLYAALIRTCLLKLTEADISLALIAARDRTLPFYLRVLGFEVIAAPRFYPPGDIPITLTALVWKNARTSVLRNRFFAASADKARVEAGVPPHSGTRIAGRPGLGQS